MSSDCRQSLRPTSRAKPPSRWGERLRLVAAASLIAMLTIVSPATNNSYAGQPKQPSEDPNDECAYSVTSSSDCMLSVESRDLIEVKRGSALVKSKEPTTVITGRFKTEMKKNSLALFRIEGNTARCFMLLGQAKVKVKDDFHITPTAGTEVILSDHDPDMGELLYRDQLGRRNKKTRMLEPGLFIVSFEFSLIQALDREPLVYALAHSHEPSDFKFKNRLIKMAAVLNMVTANHGRYMTGR